MQHVTMDFGRFGWLVTGSHQAAWGSWSRESSSHNCCRYELSMALIPFMEINNNSENIGLYLHA